jgi:hypothetical protein
MNAKLLRKIEELTLYLIEKDEKLKELELQLQEQYMRLNALEQRNK